MDWPMGNFFGGYWRALLAAIETFKSAQEKEKTITKEGIADLQPNDYVKTVNTINNYHIHIHAMSDITFGPKVSGNVTVMGNMIDSLKATNDFRNATISLQGEDQERQKLSTALNELQVVVAKLVERLPAEKADVVSRDLKSITQEAVSEAPRKAWYELSGTGIIEAAKTVAEMAEPVKTAVTAVLSLLTGS